MRRDLTPATQGPPPAGGEIHGQEEDGNEATLIQVVSRTAKKAAAKARKVLFLGEVVGTLFPTREREISERVGPLEE